MAAPTQTYKVKSGDTLSKIAKNFGVRVSDISGYRSGDVNKIFSGENLTIRARPATIVSANQGGSNVNPPGNNQNQPLPVSGLSNTMNASSPNQIAQSVPQGSLNNIAQGMGGANLNSLGTSIKAMREYQANKIATEKAKAEGDVNDLSGQVEDIAGSTQSQDKLQEVYDQFDVENKINTLQEIEQQIVDAQEALNTGLIYEADRPARMQLLVGRGASLQKQGLATIGALQGTASVIKGNIELARAYAQQTVSALQDDLDRSEKALYTLLDMADAKLVQLNKDENSLIDDRIKDIKDERDRMEKNSNKVTDLMLKYPDAFRKGGVTMLDSYASAVQKMSKFLPAGKLGAGASPDYQEAADFVKKNPDATNAELLQGIMQHTKLSKTEAQLIIDNGGELSDFYGEGAGTDPVLSQYTDDQLAEKAKPLGLVKKFNLRSKKHKIQKVTDFIKKLRDNGATDELVSAMIEGGNITTFLNNLEAELRAEGLDEEDIQDTLDDFSL